MKYMKMLGLLAVAAAALMAFAGTASATVTSPALTPYTGDIHATSGNTTLHGSVTIECKKSTVSGSISKGATTGNITTLDFSECGADTVSVLKSGSLSVTTKAGGTENEATVTSTGAEVTVLVHRTVLGFPITTHCIYTTNGTDIGTLTEGASPVLDIGSSPIPRAATDGACGDTSVWTGSYTVDTPKPLIVD